MAPAGVTLVSAGYGSPVAGGPIAAAAVEIAKIIEHIISSFRKRENQGCVITQPIGHLSGIHYQPVLIVASRARRIGGVPAAAVGGASLGRFLLDRDPLLLRFEGSVAAPVRNVNDGALSS